MVICIIALPVLAILGLFSLRYRELAKEAFRCLFRTATFKPCDSALDVRIKSKFTAKLMWWPGLARAFYKSFAVLSWIFVVLMLVSLYFSAQGIYYYAKYGNCNGPNDDSFCIFNIVSSNQPQCTITGEKQTLYPERVNLSIAEFRGNENASLTLVEYGCFSCRYTKEAEPVVQQILQNYPDVRLAYIDVPLEIHAFSIESAKAVLCAKEQGKYWEYHDILFEKQDELNDSAFASFAENLGMNTTEFNSCFLANKYQDRIDASSLSAISVGIYGTPTFFINGKSFVGPQKYSALKGAIDKAL